MKKLIALLLPLFVAGCIPYIGNPTATPIALTSIDKPAPPRAGDRYTYVVRNGYNSEQVLRLDYRVDQVSAGNYIVAINPEPSPGMSPRTATFSNDGNWIRHVLYNHDQPVDYEFSPAYPAYAFALASGQTWSQRVNARDPATGKVRSVRVDGKVLGAERIRLAAGEFDTVKIYRLIWAGDWDGFLTETVITETEWYSPKLGRAVRLDRNSQWYDRSRSSSGTIFNTNQLMRGDWHVMELAATPGGGGGTAK